MKRQGFQFKQFFIEHAHCAMKVGTDSIMLGSWIQPNDARHILDIGTGSGLLAIMLAQKVSSKCSIVGIDIDSKAVKQAQTNSQACSWPDRLAFHTIELQQLRVNHFFDLIVTNPPYFDENKTANRSVSNNERIQARQTTALSYADLLEKVVSLLSDSGCFHCVLPAERTEEFIKLAEVTGLFCQQQLEVRARPETKVIRSLLTFVRTSTGLCKSELIIYQSNNQYSQQYRDLCKEYYLNF